MRELILSVLCVCFVIITLFALATMPNRSTATIGLGGDTMLGRLMSDVILEKGPQYPWGDLLPIFKRNDLNLVNLETTFTKSNQPVPKVFNFKSDPANVQALVEANINVVNLANNHTKDFGDQGLIDTMRTLQSADIKFVGAGLNLEQARAPVVITRNGITIGILGATDNEPTWKAGADAPGTNYFAVKNMQTLLDDIAALKKQVDIVIVSLHWGPNMRQRPSVEFQEAAQKMVDAGADIIHGHSAHIFQGVEWYGGGLILYDTGDLVDDYAVDEKLRNDQSVWFEVTVSKKGVVDFAYVPLLIHNFQVNQATGKDKKEIIKRLERLSMELE